MHPFPEPPLCPPLRHRRHLIPCFSTAGLSFNFMKMFTYGVMRFFWHRKKGHPPHTNQSPKTRWPLIMPLPPVSPIFPTRTNLYLVCKSRAEGGLFLLEIFSWEDLKKAYEHNRRIFSRREGELFPQVPQPTPPPRCCFRSELVGLLQTPWSSFIVTCCVLKRFGVQMDVDDVGFSVINIKLNLATNWHCS